ncbi:unnamed protein product [Absidia cylindrospora]
MPRNKSYDTQDTIMLKKPRKSYLFHSPKLAPSRSTNKPRIDDVDISQLKPLYSIKISYNTEGMPPHVTDDLSDAEYNKNMDDHAMNKCLHQSPLTFDFLKNALNPVCENVLPIFKYFSAATSLLSFIWCEKSSMPYRQLMVYFPGSGSKLFDGIGTSVKDKVERVLIECSGDIDGDHTKEDCLKLLECMSKCLQLEMMNYRLASIATFKKRRIIGIQSIGNKITLTSTGLADATTFDRCGVRNRTLTQLSTNFRRKEHSRI